MVLLDRGYLRMRLYVFIYLVVDGCRVPREQAEASSYQEELKEVQHETEKEALPMPSEPKGTEEYHDEDERRKKRRREERREEKERKREKHEKKHSRNSDEKRKHHKDRERRRHDSD